MQRRMVFRKGLRTFWPISTGCRVRMPRRSFISMMRIGRTG